MGTDAELIKVAGLISKLHERLAGVTADRDRLLQDNAKLREQINEAAIKDAATDGYVREPSD